MFHGALFGQFVAESGEEHRRGAQGGSINWFMASARRPAAGGDLEVRGMVSAEPWTIRGCGYPNLLATGEICRGDDIHDRQHPHELISEIALFYQRPLTQGLRWHAYGGLAGEPALGPVAFQHRASAAFNPISPIAHHWLDSTHISHGVVTAGVSGLRWRAEASAFNGREPDERRTDLDLASLDSFSARLSLAPRPAVVVQASAGVLRHAEVAAGLGHRVDVVRATASLSFRRADGGGIPGAGAVTSTIAYGLNAEDIVHPTGVTPTTTHALLWEASLDAPRRSIFARAEIVSKPGHDLHVHEAPASVFTVGKLGMGFAYHLTRAGFIQLSGGGAAMLSFVPASLAPRYGGRVAPGGTVFLVLTPASIH